MAKLVYFAQEQPRLSIKTENRRLARSNEVQTSSPSRQFVFFLGGGGVATSTKDMQIQQAFKGTIPFFFSYLGEGANKLNWIEVHL